MKNPDMVNPDPDKWTDIDQELPTETSSVNLITWTGEILEDMIYVNGVFMVPDDFGSTEEHYWIEDIRFWSYTS